MTLPVFPLPAGEADANKVDAALGAQQTLLDLVIEHASQKVVDQLTSQGQNLAAVEAKLNRTVNGRLKSQSNSLAKVITPLEDVAVSRLASQEHALSSFPQGTTYPDGTYCPPQIPGFPQICTSPTGKPVNPPTILPTNIPISTMPAAPTPTPISGGQWDVYADCNDITGIMTWN